MVCFNHLQHCRLNQNKFPRKLQLSDSTGICILDPLISYYFQICTVNIKPIRWKFMKHSSKLASHGVKLHFSNGNCSYSDPQNQRKKGKNIPKLVSLKTKIKIYFGHRSLSFSDTYSYFTLNFLS